MARAPVNCKADACENTTRRLVAHQLNLAIPKRARVVQIQGAAVACCAVVVELGARRKGERQVASLRCCLCIVCHDPRALYSDSTTVAALCAHNIRE